MRHEAKVILEWPMKTALPSGNVSHSGGHWRARSSRVKRLRELIARLMLTTRPMLKVMRAIVLDRSPYDLKLKVTLTRIASRKLDDDNLSTAFKSVRDEIAHQMAIDDGSSFWRWNYAQEHGRPAIRIEIEVVPA